MKIGIMTFHWASNHGAVLQAYALQKYLSDNIKDADVFIIDYFPSRYQKTFFKSLKNKHLSVIKRNLKELKKEKKIIKFRRFLKKTRRYYSVEELKKFPPDVDVLIVGSDQIWNEFFTMKGEGVPTDAYYLPFQPNAVRFSYAASFGAEHIKQEMADYILPYLKNFDVISVRENSGVNIVEKLGLNAQVVCDPTALLNYKDYAKLAISKTKGEYIVKYFLRVQDANTKKLVSRTIKAINSVKKIVDIERNNINAWLGDIKNAKYVITNSFHAVMFSLIFHVPFVFIPEIKNLRGMNDRLETLLSVVGLKDRIIYDENCIKNLADIDWDKVDEKLDDLSKQSKAFLLDNCRVYDGKKSINFDSTKKCCGCGACAEVCSVNAIEMKQGIEGFFYPILNYDKCIKCGKCYSVCPNIHSKSNAKKVVKAYVARSKEENIRIESSSGGIFSHIAQLIVGRKGNVYGAGFGEKFNVTHICVNNQDSIFTIRGSKYVQSQIFSCYKQVEKDLKNEKEVLFSGTPCQVSALKAYLKKDYDNLVTVDIICHGVASPKLYEKYLRELEEKYKSKIKGVNFRDKRTGWENYSISVRFENGKEYCKQARIDPYMTLYLSNNSLRPSCYDCAFKGEERISDITLGDAWGIQHFSPNDNDGTGVTVVFSHTEKGEKILKELTKIVSSEIKDYSKIKVYNSALVKSVAVPATRGKLFSQMDNKTVRQLCKTCNNDPLILRMKKKIKKLLGKH